MVAKMPWGTLLVWVFACLGAAASARGNEVPPGALPAISVVGTPQDSLASGTTAAGSVDGAGPNGSDRSTPEIRPWRPKTSFDGRVGQLTVRNGTSERVLLTLWHPDSKERIMVVPLEPGAEKPLTAMGQPFTVGGDWGVQVGGPQGPVRTLVDVSSYDPRTGWLVTIRPEAPDPKTPSARRPLPLFPGRNRAEQDPAWLAGMQELARFGDPDAQFALAVAAIVPGFDPTVSSHSRPVIRAAELGRYEAMLSAGDLFEFGVGVPRDLVQAFVWYQLALLQQQGSARAGMQRIRQEMTPPQIRDGEQGVEDALARRAKRKEQARQGNLEAQADLGYIRLYGYGEPIDKTEAARWLRQAAEGGNTAAQYHLGVLLEEDSGVWSNPVEAYAWFSQAARAGLNMADARRKRLAARMKPEEVARAERVVASFPQSMIFGVDEADRIELTYRIDAGSGTADLREWQQRSVAIVQDRLIAGMFRLPGFRDCGLPVVEPLGDDRLLVRLPVMDQLEAVRTLIECDAFLVAHPLVAQASSAEELSPFDDTTEQILHQVEWKKPTQRWFRVRREVVLSLPDFGRLGGSVTSVTSPDGKTPGLAIPLSLTPGAKARLAGTTPPDSSGTLALTLNGVVLGTVGIRDCLSDDGFHLIGQLRRYQPHEARRGLADLEYLSAILRTGPYPRPIRLLEAKPVRIDRIRE